MSATIQFHGVTAIRLTPIHTNTMDNGAQYSCRELVIVQGDKTFSIPVFGDERENLLVSAFAVVSPDGTWVEV